MPTLTVTHEAPLELIRQCPDLAVDLLRAMTGVTLPDDVKATLMKTDEYKDDFIESYVQIGVDQGREVGIAETKAQDVLKVIDARKLKPTKEQRAMVTAAAGLDKLNLWFDRALTAATAAEVFAEGTR